MHGEETAVKEYLRMLDRYEAKRPFSDEKLSIEKFSKKYWLDGEFPYQYHTMNVEDGKDEKEQLVINNVRSLKNSLAKDRKRNAERMKEIEDDHRREAAHIKIELKIIAAICAAQFGANAFILIRHTQRYLPKPQNRK